MTDKEKTIKELKEVLDSLDITNKYRLNIIRAIEYLQEEPASEDLEEAANDFAEGEWDGLHDNDGNALYDQDYVEYAFKAGAKWQKEHLWKPADGNDLSEIDREVIVLTQPYPLDGTEYTVSFAHRPYKGKYIGKNLTTGNIETFENKTYDEGGWNQPNVKWWLDVDLPKAKEGKNYE